MNTTRKLAPLMKAGMSAAKWMLLILLLMVVGAFVFLKLRGDAQKAALDAQERRIAHARENLKKEISKALDAADTALEAKDYDAALAALKRAHALDLEQAWSVQIFQKKNQIREAQKAQRLEELSKQHHTLLDAQDVLGAAAVLSQIEALGVAPAVLEDFRGAQELVQQLVTHTQQFEAALKLCDVTAASRELGAIKLLEVPQERIEELESQLSKCMEEREKVAAVVAKFHAANLVRYSARMHAKVEKALAELGGQPELLKLRDALLAFPQVVHVPAEVATIDEAYDALRDGGEMVLGEGVFYTQIQIERGISIVGAGAGKTVLEAAAQDAPILLFKHQGKTSKISALSLHGIPDAEGQQSLLLVADGVLQASQVEVMRSPAYGIYVENGTLEISESDVKENRLDGIAAVGKSSKLSVRACRVSENGEHGIDAWDGAQAELKGCAVFNNAKAGIVATGADSSLMAENVVVAENRECGVYLNAGAQARLRKLAARNNQFSGIVCQQLKQLEVSECESSANGEFGYLLDAATQAVLQGNLDAQNNALGAVEQKQLK